MRVVIIYITFLLFIFPGIAWMKGKVQSPDRLIVGTWKEKSWEYEKVSTPSELKTKDTVSQTVKDQLGKHLIIHSAEIWQFQKGGKLLLIGNGQQKAVKWKLKGRGHILELEYSDHIIEHYNVTEINRDELVLNFDSDMQVKGVAKLTFKRSDFVTEIQQ